ncbi:MAG: polyphosphate polymerase domain-containing protein [Acutalibacteraceae bacterium]
MAYQSTFKRYEIKFLLTEQQKQEILQAMEPYMKLDKYGRTTIRNIYYDTENYRLIRRSLEKPVYKEKLRIRSYQAAMPGDTVFVELKKKYKKVVYKRRLTLPEAEVMKSFQQGLPLPVHSQIGDEIEYFRSYYEGLRPTVFLSYEREAFYALDVSDFRVTFDENILYRNYDFSLGSEVYGTPLLNKGETLMEIKTAGGIPLWMSHELNRLKIYRTSFSKYGFAYLDMMAKSEINGQRRNIYAF